MVIIEHDGLKLGWTSKPFLEDKDYTMEANNGLKHEFLHSCFFVGNY